MEKSNGRAEAFCRKYLQCMDPEQAAVLAGCADGYAMLEAKMVRRRLARCDRVVIATRMASPTAMAS